MALLPTKAFASVTREIPFSARLASPATGQAVPDGSYTFVFSIYSQATGGTPVWSETQTLGVVGGQVEASLGAVTSLPSAALLNNAPYYLGITVGNDAEMSPRRLIGSVVSALNAESVGGATPGTGANNVVQLDSSGNLVIQGLASPGSLNVSGATTLSTLAVSSTATFSNLVSTNSTLNGTTTVNGSIVPGSSGLNLGSSTNHFNTIYVDTLAVSSTTISGTDGNVFTLDTGQTTNNTDVTALRFYLGPTSNTYAALQWNGPANRFDLLGNVGSSTYADLRLGSLISGSATLTLPSTSDTLVGRSTTDTLTNKTLTSPVISGGLVSGSATLTLPSTSDTLVGRATTDTLANKTLTSPTINGTVSSTGLTLPGTTLNGNSSVAGTLDASGNFSVATSKFTVAAASGNTAVGGTLAVTGAASAASISVTGASSAASVSVTNDATVGGALGVTGASTLAGDLAVQGNVTLGNANTDTLTVNGRLNSSLIPSSDAAVDLGSGALRFRNFYASNAVFSSTSISNTSSSSFIINGDNTTADAESSDLEFSRGTVSPNATITWNASTQRFELNQAVYVAASSVLGSSSSNTETLRGAVTLQDSSSTNALLFGTSSDAALYRSGANALASTADLTLTKTASATSLATTKDSRKLLLQGSYWNGTAAVDVSAGVYLATLSNSPTYGLALQTAGSTRLFIDQGGSVGVNTTGPSKLLDVNGTFNAAGAATFGSSAQVTGLLTASNALTVAAGGLAVTGDSTITGALGGITGLTVASGGASVTGDLTQAGNILPSGTRDIGASANRFANGYFTNLDVTNLTGGSTGSSFTGTVAITSVTNPQLTVKYDTSDYLSIGVASNGATTFTAAGTGAAIALANQVTVSSSLTVSGTGGNELAATGAPAASATSSLIRFGGAIAGGNASTGTGGTYVGINEPSSGAGSTADFLDLQNNGSQRLKLDYQGNLTIAGNLTTASTGTNGFWTRSGTTLQPATSGDSIATAGTISTTGSADADNFLVINESPSAIGTTNYNAGIRIEKGGVKRWDITANTAAETGSNAGSFFNISSYDDSGTYIGTPIAIGRSSQSVSLNRSMTSGVDLSLVNTVTQPNATDTGNTGAQVTEKLLATSASTDLIQRGLGVGVTNSLTGGGSVTLIRGIDVNAISSSGSSTGSWSDLFLENSVNSGTVTTGYGVNISSLPGTTKYGVYDQTGSTWLNTTGTIQGATLSDGTGTLTSGLLSTTASTALQATGTPTASAFSSQVQIGSTVVSGAASGTYLSVNSASNFGGDLINLEVGGSTRFKVSSSVATFTSSGQGLGGVQLSSGVGPWLREMPDLTNASYNPVVQAGDAAFIYTAGSQGTGGMVIAPWAGTSGGIRLDSSGNQTETGSLTVTNGLALSSSALSGATTISASGSITSTATSAALKATGAPTGSATSSLLQLGAAISGGSSSGTYVGVNAGSGYAGNLVDLQVNNSSKLKVDASGNLTAAGTVTATKALKEAFVSVASSATPAFDASQGNTFQMTLTANVTSSSITNPTAGQVIRLILVQDATGGWTMAWPANVKLAGGSFTLTATASKEDTITLVYDGTNWIELSRSTNL